MNDFDPWTFLRNVLARGCAIEHDTVAGGRNYEQHSARLDAAARELAEKLRPHLVQPRPVPVKGWGE